MTPPTLDSWYLEGYTSTGALVRTAIEELPFAVGRRSGLGLTLASPEVSQSHAEIVRDGDGLAMRDLGSTNGTFVNRRRVEGTAALADGDVLHFADQEFRLVRERRVAESVPRGTLRLDELDLPRRFAGYRVELQELIAEEAVAVRYEPIVRLTDDRVIAWEALTRGTSAALPAAPAALFAAAEESGLAAELSRLCRRRAVAEAEGALGAGVALFLNCHPSEVADAEALIESMAEAMTEVREAGGGRSLVLEIHESAVTDPGQMTELRDRLREIGVGLAYDDFGAGQARLLELSEAPPDHLKVDRRLVTGIDRAAPSRVQVLETLVGLAESLGISTVAEGIETPGELEACRRAGFTAAQGHLLARDRAVGHPA